MATVQTESSRSSQSSSQVQGHTSLASGLPLVCPHQPLNTGERADIWRYTDTTQLWLSIL